MSTTGTPGYNPQLGKFVPTREVYTVVNEEANQRQWELLNETERQKLTQFSDRLSTDYPHDVKDKVTLVRFLKARKWDLNKSEVMFRNRMKWIEEYQPHKITEKDILPCAEAGKAFYYGRDKLGRPILVIRAACHRSGEGKEAQELFFKYFVYLSEVGQMMAPLPPHNSYLILYDRNGSTRHNFDPKGALKMVSMGDYYPEMVGTACVLYPNFLYQMLFKATKAFLDPVTISKIKLFNPKKEEMIAELLEMTGSRDQMLPDMGGNSQSRLPHYPPSVPDKYVTKFRPDGSSSGVDEEETSDTPSTDDVAELGDAVNDLDLD